MPKKKESKKRAAPPSLQELLDRPWCYYCERDFDDVKVLLSHQKAKHFKCNSCFTRTLSTPGGLRVHMAQVHKITMTEIENALPGRGDPNTEIFAMIGIPDAIMEAHKQRVAQSYYDAEAAHRKETGNPPPGTKTGADGNKKRKMETPEELKQRLAEHKAKKAAEKAAAQAGVGNDSATPVDAGDHAEAPSMYPMHVGQFQPSFGQAGFGPPPPNHYAFQANGAGVPPTYGYPGFAPRPLSSGPQYPQQPQLPAEPYPAQRRQQPSDFYSGTPPTAPGMMPGLPQAAPGLPQRPSFQAPNYSKEEMAAMHGGYQGAVKQDSKPVFGDGVDRFIESITGETSQAPQQMHTQWSQAYNYPPMAKNEEPQEQAAKSRPNETEQETTIPNVDGTKSQLAAPTSPAQALAPQAAGTAGKLKRLIYTSKDVSPEEKLASQVRYAFVRNVGTELVQGEPSGTGMDGANDTVTDPQDMHPGG